MCKDTDKPLYERIDELQMLDELYYIDYVPYETPDTKFLELETFFEKTYIHSFAKKMARIVLKLIYHYTCESFYLDKIPIKPASPKYKFNFKDNLLDSSPKKLTYFMRQVIANDFSGVQVLFSEPVFLININGGFSNEIYQPTTEVVELLKLLTKQEGLFLKFKNSAGEHSLV